jgi:hypothetical protein
MGAGRWTWPPGETLRARLAMCGALGRASVNSGAADQRSPNDVDPFHVAISISFPQLAAAEKVASTIVHHESECWKRRETLRRRSRGQHVNEKQRAKKSLAQRTRLDTGIAHYLYRARTGQRAFTVLHRRT